MGKKDTGENEMKEISIHVGQKIRLYRKMKGLTIEVFAGMIHKSKATVSKYENGDISIDIETLFVIAQALEIPVNQLIDYTKEEAPAEGEGTVNHQLTKSRYNMYIYDGRRTVSPAISSKCRMAVRKMACSMRICMHIWKTLITTISASCCTMA